MRNLLKEYSDRCPICGIKNVLADLKITCDDVEFSYQCGHIANLRF